jgi:TfoX/Sxy family transcriptional regulator of competence genes
MAYDENLAKRIRAEIGRLPGLMEKKMFGGVGFLVQGNMACGVHGDDLIVRVGPEQYDQSLAQPDTRPFDMTGRPMTGWILVAPAGVADDETLAAWIRTGMQYALSLPSK